MLPRPTVTLAGEGEVIVVYGPGSFIGELAQLTGRPALARARSHRGPALIELRTDPGQLSPDLRLG